LEGHARGARPRPQADRQAHQDQLAVPGSAGGRRLRGAARAGVRAWLRGGGGEVSRARSGAGLALLRASRAPQPGRGAGVRPLILASASPRRREILARLGLEFRVSPADVDETRAPDEPPEQYVARVAEDKARAIAGGVAGPAAVLGADTTVVIDGEVLGKPRDAAD